MSEREEGKFCISLFLFFCSCYVTSKNVEGWKMDVIPGIHLLFLYHFLLLAQRKREREGEKRGEKERESSSSCNIDEEKEDWEKIPKKQYTQKQAEKMMKIHFFHFQSFPFFLQSFPFFLQSFPFFLQSFPFFLQSFPFFLQSFPFFLQSFPFFSPFLVPSLFVNF